MMAEGPQVRGLWLFYTHLRARLSSSASPLKDREVVFVFFFVLFLLLRGIGLLACRALDIFVHSEKSSHCLFSGII